MPKDTLNEVFLSSYLLDISLVGGGAGDLWVFRRTGGSWAQQGGPLSALESPALRPQTLASVALSADGNTVLMGKRIGVWVFTQTGGAWSQQGTKLIDFAMGAGNNVSYLGSSVALSPDGGTAFVSGGAGAFYVWVFAHSGGAWTQQGSSYPTPDGPVAWSADGKTMLVGGANARTFMWSGGTWIQQGTRFVGGESVAISGDGGTGLITRMYDQPYGSVSVFASASASEVSLSATPNPSFYGQSVMFAATVTPGATGTVTFFVDGVPHKDVVLNGTSVEFTTANLPGGQHSICAIYGGDFTYAGSPSNLLTETVARLPFPGRWVPRRMGRR